MRSLLAVFGLLAAVLSEGYSLCCEKCISHDSTSCHGPIKGCKKGSNTCYQGFENNTLGDNIRLTAVKGCHNPQEMPPILCKAPEHMFTNSYLIYRFVAECGKGMGELKVTPLNLIPNGKKCPDCFKVDTLEECKTDKLIECRGPETDCFNYQGTAERPGSGLMSYSFQGCSTPGLCSIMRLFPGTKVNVSASQYKCTSAS
ncbi:phospholipase A2 inhibitor gamma subunit B-like [Lissotriton helveticus]